MLILLCPLLCCNDHDWGDSDSYDLENLFKPRDEYGCDNIKSGFGRMSNLAKNNPTYLESVQSYEILIKVCMERS